MTKEEEFVVNPLIEWFRRQKAAWEIIRPAYGTAATGWDIEARRKNQDLLIEAKFMSRAFVGSFNGLVTAPLVNRRQRFMKKKYRSWSYAVCWAIGVGYDKRDVYQILFDYFSRNPTFWEHYSEDLRLKYVFFVKDRKVARVPFNHLLDAARDYALKAEGKTLKQRRVVANELMNRYIFS